MNDREIKFKAWDLLNHCWLLPKDNYPQSVLGTQQTAESDLIDVGNIFRLNYVVKKEHNWGMEGNNAIICMFTGLKDKNGTEIYEGDIIRLLIGSTPKTIGHITYGGWQYFVTMEVAGKDKTNYFGFNSEDIEPEKIEVIGNIWENVNLLEQ